MIANCDCVSLQDGNIAIHEAVKEGHVDVVEYLVKAGADINMQDKV